MSSLLLPPGFKDEIFDQASIEHKYKNLIINLFQSNGYKLIKPPMIEYADKKNIKNAFLIKEKKSNKGFVLRDDITLQIARIANSRLIHKNRPLKLSYYGEVIRKKGTMLRPERQFLQVGAECIGEHNYLADVEMLDLAYQALISVGIKKISIELSSSEFLNFLLKKIKSIKERNKIILFLRRKDLGNCLKILDTSLHSYVKNLLGSTGNLSKKRKIFNKLGIDEKTKIAQEELLLIFSTFIKKYPKKNFFLDLSESNYLEYHTGTRFTFYANNVRGEVARGGRYVSKFNSKKESSTGFTCFMDTIIRASSFVEKNKKILIPFETSDKKKKKLISDGYVLDTFFGKKNNIKEIAVKNKIKYCLINNKIVNIKI